MKKKSVEQLAEHMIDMVVFFSPKLIFQPGISQTARKNSLPCLIPRSYKNPKVEEAAFEVPKLPGRLDAWTMMTVPPGRVPDKDSLLDIR